MIQEASSKRTVIIAILVTQFKGRMAISSTCIRAVGSSCLPFHAIYC